MAFTTYPDAATSALLGIPANKPVPLASGAAMTQFVPLANLHGPDPAQSNLDTTFVRISMSIPASVAISPPQVDLIAVNPGAATQGSPVTITAQSINTAQSLKDGTNPTSAAAAYFEQTAFITNNVYLLKIVIEIAGTTFKIKITNNTAAARDFVWVVADRDADVAVPPQGAQQPWIQLTPFGPFKVLVNDPASATAQPIQINNRGTGPLTVQKINPALAAPYSLMPPGIGNSGLPATVIPNPDPADPKPANEPANVLIGFAAPATTGSTPVSTYTVDGDTGAVADPTSGHNDQFTLSATTTQVEVVMVLDDSGSMAATDTSSGGTVTRLSELQSATTQFLNFLAAFGGNGGNIGVVIFPGSDPGNPGNLPSYDLIPARTIPATWQATDLAPITNLTPVDNTPMDFALKEVLGRVAPQYFFTDATSIANNRRWMLLMSDGAWNVGQDPRNEITPTSFFKNLNVVVYSAGFGRSGQVDYATLQAIQSGAAPGGTSSQVDLGTSLTTATDLAKTFKKVITNGLTINTAADPDGVISLGQEARFQVFITPYDTKAVFSLNWNTPNDALSLQLLTPTCDLITPQTAANTPGITFNTDPRYRMYVIDGSYLRNDANPSQPRHGTWRIIVSYPNPILLARGSKAVAAAGPGENYSYSVLTASSLKLDVSLDRAVYYAGDPIVVAAKVTLNGLPVTGATAQLSVTAPGQSMDNWLAGIPISDQEYQNAAKLLAGKDAWPVYIKAYAAQLKGFVFNGLPQNTTIPMSDPNQIGVYSATVNQTTIPDGHTLYVTVTGTTRDGVVFRRDRTVDVRVGVLPDSVSTIIGVVYDAQQTNPNLISATVSVTPRDRFGNVILADPATSQTILLQAQGATLDPKLTTTFNGTYSSHMTYKPGATPTLSLTVGGTTIVKGQVVPPVDKLIWVDQVVAFTAGLEAVRGANQHTDPNAALGDVRTKPVGFVSLGGYGVLSVAIKGQSIQAQGDDDVTVFVQPDDDLRAYLVEAQAEDDDAGWVALGTSPGSTSSFGLRKAGLRSARAIRITDKSGRTRDANFKPLATPGVSIRGVGVKSVGEGDGGGGNGEDDVCIRLRVLNPQRQPLGGKVDLEFEPQESGETLDVKGADASKDIDVKGLQRTPQGLYQATVTPTDVFVPTSQFVTIPASGFITVEFIIDKRRAKED